MKLIEIDDADVGIYATPAGALIALPLSANETVSATLGVQRLRMEQAWASDKELREGALIRPVPGKGAVLETFAFGTGSLTLTDTRAIALVWDSAVPQFASLEARLQPGGGVLCLAIANRSALSAAQLGKVRRGVIESLQMAGYARITGESVRMFDPTSGSFVKSRAGAAKLAVEAFVGDGPMPTATQLRAADDAAAAQAPQAFRPWAQPPAGTSNRAKKPPASTPSPAARTDIPLKEAAAAPAPETGGRSAKEPGPRVAPTRSPRGETAANTRLVRWAVGLGVVCLVVGAMVFAFSSGGGDGDSGAQAATMQVDISNLRAATYATMNAQLQAGIGAGALDDDDARWDLSQNVQDARNALVEGWSQVDVEAASFTPTERGALVTLRDIDLLYLENLRRIVATNDFYDVPLESIIAEIDENVSALCAAEDQLNVITTDTDAAYADRHVGCAPELVAEINEFNTRWAAENKEWY